MEVSPKTLREVEFREKMRGYHQEDVDQFLEQVAVAFEVLHDRLRQAVERAQRAEAAANEAAAAAQDNASSDETLRRTLVLAQRTADLAVSEAREQAARLLAGAEQQAQGMLADAEERARRAHEESLAEMRADLARLEAKRQQAQGEVDLIRRWVEEQRNHLTGSLRDALRALERAGTTSAPPPTRPIDLPQARTPEARSAEPPPRPSSLLGALGEPGPPEQRSEGPETVAWSSSHPAGETGGYLGQGSRPPEPAPRPEPAAAAEPRRDPLARPAATDRPEPGRPERGRPRPGASEAEGRTSRPETKPPAAVVRAETADASTRESQVAEPQATELGARDQRASDPPDEQALDDFFDDERFAEERRFGGRLRRRR